MVGVTLYVSITTEESVKIDQDYPVMKCLYGYSFLCAVFSFVLQELTGVLTVYWFIYRFRALVRKQEKLRERTRQLMGNCLSMTTALPLNLAALNAVPNRNSTNPKLMNNRPNTPINQNHFSTPDNNRYPYMSSDGNNTMSNRQQSVPQRRRLPFERTSPLLISSNQPIEKHTSPSFPPRSPTLPYGDYCRVLIRAEDLELLTQMVKSKSQAQLLANSRPSTPAPTSSMTTNTATVLSTTLTNTRPLTNSRTSRQLASHPNRRSTRKGVKRTTSV